MENVHSSSIVALVTGGSRGIGLEIVRGLASQGVTTVFTSRSKSKGDELAELLSSKEHFRNVFHHELDLTNHESISSLASWFKLKFGTLDILINNAGLYTAQIPELLTLDRAKRVLQTNFYGPKDLVAQFLPFMNDGARIINITSAAGRLDFLSGHVQERWAKKLLDSENLTNSTLEAFVEDFFNAVESNELQSQGWPWLPVDIPGYPGDDVSDYSVSKIALNAWTCILAKEQPNLYVNALCPGLNNTEMTYHSHGQPAKEGADTAIWLALLPASECSSGNFFVKRKEVSFVNIPLHCNDRMAFSHNELVEMLWGLMELRGLMLQSLNLCK